MSAVSIILITACLPSVVLLIYIYKKDKVDKEPFSLLLLLFALFVPIAAHGTYDFLCSYGSAIATILFLVFLIALYIICFRRIRLVSKFDNHEANMIASVLYKRYPYLYDRIRQVQQANYIAYYNSYPNPNPAPYQNTNQYQNQNNYTYR
ncbi:MAG: hypothetical protein E7570_04745 [Ruminococcaceae bacterium]|nr:hypothetical protein [Oscillospiraceae bacterium]